MAAPNKVSLLPKDFGSLNRGLPPAEPGTLFVLGSAGGIRVAPDASFEVVFGRNAPDAHVCVGANDAHVSRRHGTLSRPYRHWVLTNLGRLPIRFPGSWLVLSGDHDLGALQPLNQNLILELLVTTTITTITTSDLHLLD